MKKPTMLVTAALIGAALAGCAATVQRGPTADAAPIRIPAESSRNIVMNVTGSSVATESDDWEPFKGEWRAAMAAAAASRGAGFSTQEGAPRATGQPGTLVIVDVNDYRYLTPGARFGLGVMIGNAYVDAKVRFADLKTGASLGERTYNTSSSAWQGIFSAMTDKQVQAICREVIAEIDPR